MLSINIRAGVRAVYNILFVLASSGSLVLSYVTTASGGAASPGLGGQCTPRGKGKGKHMGTKITNHDDPMNFYETS